MTGRFQRARAIFEDAIELPPDRRDAFVREACGDDDSLRERVRVLLAADDLDPVITRSGAPPASPGRVEISGDRIGSYRLVRSIASGGMGAVYEGEQERPRRSVAVKILAHALPRPEARARFLQEVEVLAQLRHPNIVEIHDAGTHESDGATLPYFVMELIEEAETITESVARRKLSTIDRVRQLLPVCAAVQYGHARGVIHRDLKPANILVGADGTPKVIDFGVARCTHANLDAATIQTTDGSFLGTLPYMSPEQCRGRAGDVDARSDGYALGVILYEMLSGSLPYEFDDKSPLAIARTITETPARMLSALAPDAPADLVAIVHRAIAKEADRRYQTVNEFARDLQRFLHGRPVEARIDSRWYVLGKTLTRYRRSVIALTVVLLTLCGLVGALVIARGRAEANAERLRRNDYLSLISQAERLWLDGDLSSFDDVMARCPKDLRGWEWTLLDRDARKSQRRYPVGWAAVTVSDDGRVFVGRSDGRLTTIDLDTGEEEPVFAFDEPLAVSVIVPAADDLAVRIARWEPIVVARTTTGEIVCTLPPGLVKLSPDGRSALLAVRGASRLEQWDLVAGARGMVIPFTDEVADARAIAFAPDGMTAAVGLRGGTIAVLDLSSGDVIREWAAHEGMVTITGFGPDRTIYSAGHDRFIRRWDRDAGTLQETFDRIPEFAMGFSLSPDGTRLAVPGSGGRVWVFDPLSGALLTRWSAHPVSVTACHWLEDGERVLTFSTSAAGEIRVSRMRTHLWRRPHSHRTWIDRLAVTPDDQYVVSAGQSRDVAIWRLRDGVEVGRTDGHEGRIMAIAVSPDSSRVASVDSAGLARCALIPSGAPEAEVRSPRGGFSAVAWASDETALLSTAEGAIVRWSPAATRHEVIMGGQGRLASLVVHRERRLVATGGADGTVWIRATDTLEPVGRFNLDQGVRTLAFLPDGARVAAGLEDGAVVILDTDDGRTLCRGHPHELAPKQIVPSPDGTRLITVAWNERARLIDTRTGRVVLTLFPLGTAADPLALNADWSLMAVAGADFAVELWPMVEHTWPTVRSLR